MIRRWGLLLLTAIVLLAGAVLIGQKVGRHRVEFAAGAVALVLVGHVGAVFEHLEGVVGPVETLHAEVGVLEHFYGPD